MDEKKEATSKDGDALAGEKPPTATAENGVDFGNNVHISGHPVLAHKVSVLRSSSTPPAGFRAVLREVTFYLGYEATATLNTRPVSLTVPMRHDHVHATGKKLVERIALIPKMRSGLGMVDSMLELIPTAGVYHIGMYKRGLLPVMYYNRLPKKCEVDVAYVLDVVIASAATVSSVIGILKKWGVPKIHVICVIGSSVGISSLAKAHPDVYFTVGEVDDKVVDGQVTPGLGDAGDRLFRTPLIDDEESLLHVSKRKRAGSF